MTRLATLLISSLLFGLVPATVRAQRPTQLPDLQVTATRLAVPVGNVPASVTVLDGQDLRDRGITYLLDALRLVPSAAVVQTGSYGAITSLFLRGGESDQTKILVDGVVINEPGGAMNLATLSLEDIDRIEVVRGPTSVLYGADAVSGVVRLFTRRGSQRPTGSLEATAGSFGGRDLRGRVAGTVGPVAGSFSGSHFGSDGIYPFNSRFENSNATAALDWQASTGSALGATLRYSDAVGRFPTDGNGDPVDTDQRTLAEDLVVGLRGSHRIGQRVELSVEGWSHHLDSRFRDGRDGPADTTGFGFSGTRDARTTRRGASLQSDWRAAPDLTIVVGGALERESESQETLTESNFGFGISSDATEFEADRATRSLFAQALLSPIPDVELQAGGRLDDNTAFGTFTTVRAGVVLHLDQRSRIWTSVGTGFKAPTFSELFAASPYEVGNPALRPEESRSAEVGIEWAGRGLRLGMTAFTQEFTDLVQYVSAAPGEPTYANLGAARSRGVEASVIVTASRSLTVDAHVTWLSTEVTDSGAVSSETFTLGAPLLRRPAVSGTVTARGNLGSMMWSATGRWVGSRDDVNFRDFPATRTRLPSYGLIDAAVTVPLPVGARPGADLVLRGENLFDAAWDAAIGYPGRGRTLFGGARLSF